MAPKENLGPNLLLWTTWLGANVVFAAWHPALADELRELSPFATSLVVNAVLFVLPAVGWSWVVAARSLGFRLFSIVAISTVSFVASLAVVRVLGWTLADVPIWNLLWLLSNVGFVWALWRRGRVASHRLVSLRSAVLGGAVFLGAYGFYYWGATHIVPPENDHDLEVQATGYGLLSRFEPLLLTDRGPLYFFAHPPLLHLYVGGSFLLHGAIDELQYYDEVSLRALHVREGRDVPPPSGRTAVLWWKVPQVRSQETHEPFVITGAAGTDYLLVSEGGGVNLRIPGSVAEEGRIYLRYEEHPNLLETRTPNLFLASATVALLALWVGGLSRRWWMGLLVAVAYATNPEVFVRSSYGGYFAIGSFASIMMLLATDRWRRARMSALTGVFASIADHKLVLLPAAVGFQALIKSARRSYPRLLELFQPQRIRELMRPTIVGFVLGTVLFWAYGLLIAPWDFYQDHLRHHLINRIAHLNYLGYTGYPSALGLWTEFAAHTAYVVLPVGLALLLRDLLWPSAPASPRRTSLRVLLLIYVAVTAAAFTVIDWRMTKHLALLLIPLHLVFAPDPRAPAWRVVVPVVALLFALGYNAFALESLVADYDSFVVTPAW